MTGHGVVSADSHMTEPADLWEKRLDRRFRDRSPKVIESSDSSAAHLFVAEGAPPMAVAAGFAAGRSGKELAAMMKQGYEAARPGGWDPVERIKDQELDGVDAEILYPTLGMATFAMSDPELQRACFTTYNDWLAEFCGHDPKRLYGIGLISLEDIDDAVEDLARISKQGMRGAMIWAAPPEDRPYDDRLYDRFWQAASEHQLPLSLHIVTGRGRHAAQIRDALGSWGGRVANAGVLYTVLIHEIQNTLAVMVFGGVFERFPELRVVSAESDSGWLPHFLYRMDHAYEKYVEMMLDPPPLRPSDYMRRQVWATFQDDPVGPANHAFFDAADRLMWASDFPHADSTFPESRAWIEKNFADVPDDVTRKIVYENAVALYRMDIA